SFVISELIKLRFNQSKKANCYFWRDSQGHEVDCLLEYGDRLVPVEIKSAITINQNFFDPLISWQEIASPENKEAYVVYAGQDSQARKHGMVIGWDNIDLITQSNE